MISLNAIYCVTNAFYGVILRREALFIAKVSCFKLHTIKSANKNFKLNITAHSF